MTTFTVVDASSSYNIILGRPVMNELKAVASIYHQKIKFPVRNQVGEIRGDQPSSRKCYVETIRVDQKKERREKEGGGRTEEMERISEKGKVHFLAEEEQEVVEFMPGKEILVARDLGLSTRELVGISSLVAEHSLYIIPGSQHIKQKKRHFGPEKDKAAGKWRMYVDFRDLNKECPKDHYPLPRIDQLVNSTSGYKLLSFMDAYQG
ncbi:uncharacterized protein LOC142520320 [Primulina tabacum]|uniref:uncharacterized protein LOC142520320 n=1 Tax=Primulina tabacum TaxID=48773 RepID=UPI003F5A0742